MAGAAMVSSLLSANPLSLCLCISTSHSPRIRLSPSLAFLRSSSSSSSHESSSATQNEDLKLAKPSIKAPFVESSKPPDKAYNYALANLNGNHVGRFVQSTESSIERDNVWHIVIGHCPKNAVLVSNAVLQKLYLALVQSDLYK